MSVNGKKVLMVIASNNFRDEEYAEPRKTLEAAGVRVTVACSTLSIAKGKLGLEVKPDVLISEVNEAEYDGIVFAGGGGASAWGAVRRGRGSSRPIPRGSRRRCPWSPRRGWGRARSAAHAS